MLIRIDLAGRGGRLLYNPNPLWRPQDLPRVERLDAKDWTGEDAYGYLVYPYDYQPGRTYPLVIVQYRVCGFLRRGRWRRNPDLAAGAARLCRLEH